MYFVLTPGPPNDVAFNERLLVARVAWPSLQIGIDEHVRNLQTKHISTFN